MPLAVAALILTGCSLVFPLRDDPREVDAAVDAEPPPDSPPPRCPGGNDATRSILPAVADAAIFSGVPTQSSGALGVATISSDLGPQGSRGLFRFELGTIDPATVLELQLVLPSAMTSDDCASDCGACAGIERPGAMHAFPSTSTWVEQQVSWARASTAVAWESPGASGSDDRGPELLPAAEHAIAANTTFVAGADQVAAILAWSANEQLSFVVETAMAKQVVRTRENVCDGGASGARLEVLGC